jgi:hypothetical protein
LDDEMLQTMLQVIDPVVAGGVLTSVVFFGILGSLAAGRRIGERTIARHGDAGLANATSLETAVFAILGLLIAFAFSGALTRFDVRRSQIVDEANAIGTAYLRIDLLPQSAQPRLRETFRNYVDARIATYKKLPDLQAAHSELARSQQLQSDIWAQAVAATRLPDSRTGTEVLVMPALNQMFDITTVRLMATQMHPPIIIFVMLVALAFASALLAGYQSAPGKAYDWVHQLGFAAIVAFTVFVILDIEFPRLGFVRVDATDQVLVSVRASMK